MDDQGMFRFATEIFGEGCETNFLELAELHNRLAPEDQKVIERLLDTFGTGLRVFVKQLDADQKEMIRAMEAHVQGLSKNMDEHLNLVEGFHSRWREGLAIGFSTELMRRGVTQAQMNVILDQVYAYANNYIQKGK